MDAADLHRDLGRLEGRVSALEASVRTLDYRLGNIEQALAEIKEIIGRARGGWQALTLLATGAAALGGAVAWLLGWLKN